MPKRLAVIYNTFDEQKIQALAMQSIADIPTALYVIFIGCFSQEKRFELINNW
jgi:hypothetical protein